MSNLYKVGGALPLDAPSYIGRQADQDLYEGLLAGEFCYVLNSRQMGKSSLRVQTMRRLQDAEVACATIDITKIGSQGITPEEWYAGLLFTLINQLQLPLTLQQFEDWWEAHRLLSPVNRFSEFIDGLLLAAITDRIVIFIDEIDSILQLNFKDDFFAAIRACYNKRAENTEYERLTFALLGVATPSNLIQDKNRTPFNIGRAVQLNGFQFDEARSLAQGLVSKAANPEVVLQTILSWTGGQPFLTQKLCQLALASSSSIADGEEETRIEQLVQSRLIANWESQDEPEHLRTIRDRVLSNEQRAGRLLGIYQQILQQEAIEAEASSEQIELQLSGLVAKQRGQLKVYNRIYKAVFEQQWIDQMLAVLRPYASAITAWLASHQTDESLLLRGQTLKNAQTWAVGKSLSDQDYQFLSASQELEKRNVQLALAAEKEANEVLSQAQGRAAKRIRIGSIVLTLSLLGAAIASVLASKANQHLFSATTDLNRIQKEKSQLKREKSQLQLDTNRLGREIQETKQGFQVAIQNKEQAERNAEEARKIQRKAESARQTSEQKFQQVNQSLFETRSNLEKAGQEVQAVNQRVEKANQQAEEAIQKTESARSETEAARQEQSDARNELAKVQSQLDELKPALSQAFSFLNEVGTARRTESGNVATIQIDISKYTRTRELVAVSVQKIGISIEGSDRNLPGSFPLLLDTSRNPDIRLSTPIEVNSPTKVKPPPNKADLQSRLFKEGLSSYQQGNLTQAVESFRQMLAISQEVGDRKGESLSLKNLGELYLSLGQYQKALEVTQQTLKIQREIGDRQSESLSLNRLGVIYSSLGNYAKALELYQQSLSLSQEAKDRRSESANLRNLGEVYTALGQFPKALEYYQQSLAISKEIKDRNSEGSSLNNLGVIYASLGRNQQAIEYYMQALLIQKTIGDRLAEASSLSNLGLTYASLGEYQRALEFHQQALLIQKAFGNRSAEASSLSNLGLVYAGLGQNQKALESYKTALYIKQEVGDRVGQGTIFNNIGATYASIKQYQEAVNFYQQALAISKEVGNRTEEAQALRNIGFTLVEQHQPGLAIAFLKQSVNIREQIRQNLRALPQESQQSYTDTVDGTYRRLADLLLKQDRILEARQVLDLLVAGRLEGSYQQALSNASPSSISISSPEQQILMKYNAQQQTTIQLGQELTQLRKIPKADSTLQQQQRIAQLVQSQIALNQQFNQFINSSEVVSLVKQLSSISLSPTDLDSFRSELRRSDAALLYYLVLEDRLEVIIVTPDAPPLRRTVNISQKDLNLTILRFRQTLQDPTLDAQPAAQQLYSWLIKPIENDLMQSQVKTIIYVPDRQLRYIPLAALHDGKKWLAENYQINNITSVSLTNFKSASRTQPRVLAAAFNAGDRNSNFRPLPFATLEVQTIAKLIPTTTLLLNNDFNINELSSRASEYNIIHLATHSALVAGNPEDSFILFGDGNRLSLKDIGDLSLPNVDLVVLSASETAIGGQLANGEEISSLGYQFQKAGARAVIASLWAVNDRSTQILMEKFYTEIAKGTKPTAALRLAQVSLIRENSPILTGSPAVASKNFSHPYYWAPFILIGNGL